MIGPLSVDHVTRVLAARLDPSAACTALARGPVGNGQETWFVEASTAAGPRSLVLRRTAPGGPLAWTDRRGEYDTMAAVAAAGLPVPRVHWFENGASGLGRPYFVMDRAPGGPGACADDPEAVAAELGRLLARLHAADVAAPGRGGDPGRGGPADAATLVEVGHWSAVYDAGGPAPLPLLAGLLAWLATNRPRSERTAVLLWGDPGPHNLLVDGDRVTAMLDWELAHHGDPLEDVGSALWFYDARLDPEVLVGAYESECGSPVDRDAVDYFVAMACVTRAVMVYTGAASFAAGDTSEPSAAALGIDLLNESLTRAVHLAGWGEPPDTMLPGDSPPTLLRPTQAEVDAGVARFLRDTVLSTVADPRTRRGVKTAAALLETNAVRAGAEAALAGGLEAEAADLVATAGVGGDLAALARAVETDPDLAALRPRVRQLLLDDLAARRALGGPLRDLYG